MILVLLGLLLIITAFLCIQFPDLIKSLKNNDEAQWKLLGSPSVYAFSKSLSVFSWIIHRGFEKSPSPEVIEQGKIAYKKALILKYTLIAGLILLLLGFGLAILKQVI